MKIVAGLGNPGAQYNFTRHNTGFLALDFYFKRYDLSWGVKPHLGAVTGASGDFLFVKPQDFYNNSGVAVAALARYYKVPLSDILVICDDFNLEFGKVRFREAGSAGGNNGLKSVINELKSEDFARIRVGTGNDTLRRQMGDVDFVLSRFSSDEKTALPDVLDEVGRRINEWAAK